MAHPDYEFHAREMHRLYDKYFDKMPECHDIIKDIVKNEYKRRTSRLPDDVLELPLWFATRWRYIDDESVTEYGYVNPDEIDGYTSVEEYVRDNFEVRNCSPYDCSGMLVTSWLHWHENPDGTVSVIHHMVLDI